MAIAFVAGQEAGTNDAGANTDTLQAALPENATAGNSIVVAIGTNGDATLTVSSVTDTQSNVYSQLASEANSDPLANAYLWIATNISGGAVTVTAVISQARRWTLSIGEFSGIKAVDPLASLVASATGNSTAPNPGDVTPNLGDALVVSVGGSNGARAWTAGEGLTLFGAPAAIGRCGAQYEVIAGGSGVPQNAEMSLASATGWAAVGVALAPAASGLVAHATSKAYYRALMME
jgi:hypothetical protein